jgi:hypothetical protein
MIANGLSAFLAGCGNSIEEIKHINSMLDLPGQIQTCIIVDALDECPNNTGTPSARERVLNFVEDLVQSNHSNLFICITVALSTT